MRGLFLSLVVLVACSDDPVPSCPRGTPGCICGPGDRCDDGLVCNGGTCVFTGDCGRSLRDGDLCSDGDPCSAGDVCRGAECVGTTYSCADGVACTDDICDGAGGCDVQVSTGFCWIDSECYGDGTAGDVPCLVCDPSSSQTTWSPDDGAACDDGDPCSHSDACNGASCAGNSYGCDDGNHCTVNVCNGDGTCSFVEVPQSCVIQSVCYPPGMTEPGNPCAHCDPSESASAWTTLADDASCDDDDPCTADEVCSAGVCAGTPYACDDGKDCTVDTCDGVGSCTVATELGWCIIDDVCVVDGEASLGAPCTVCDPSVDASAWTELGADDPCDDGLPCTENDVCDAGGACAGTPYVCNDDNECTTDTCDGLGGCGEIPLTGPPCNDGDSCTRDDDCGAGACGGTPYVCDDDIDCTTDVCDGEGGCGFTLIFGQCLIDAGCFTHTDPNPANPCQWCEQTAPTAWSDNDAGMCSDNDACTDDDFCSGGVCSGTPLIADPYEDNDTTATAHYLGSVNDDVSFPAGTFQATLYGTGDVDFYSYQDNDTLGSMAARVELSDIPSGSNYRLCAYFSCDGGSNSSVSCSAGSSSTLASLDGCCSNNAGSASEVVELGPDCNNGFPSDDSGLMLVRVDHTGGAWSCTSAYTINWGDD